MIPYTFYAFSTGFSMGPSVRELHIDRSLTVFMPHVPMLFILSVLFGGLFLVGLIVLWRRRDTWTFLTLWMSVPIIGALSISALTNMAYNVRYVAMALPAYVLVLAAAIASFRRPAVRMALLGAVLVVHGVALANYYFDPRYARADARAAAQYLESAVQARDVVLIVGAHGPLQYYSSKKLPIVNFGGLHKTGQPIVKRLQELQKGHDRLWLVEIRPWQTDPTGKIKAVKDLQSALNLISQDRSKCISIGPHRLGLWCRFVTLGHHQLKYI